MKTNPDYAANPGEITLAGVGTMLANIGRNIVWAVQMARRASEVEHLFKLSDAELARRGLSRDRLFEAVYGRNG